MTATVTKPSTTPAPGAADVLRFADLIQGQARRLEILATWRDVTLRNIGVKADGERRGLPMLLRDISASRVAGIDNDVGFFLLCSMAEGHAETIFGTDPALNELTDKIEGVKRREGLSEDEEFIRDHPDIPADWKKLTAEYDCRFEEIVSKLDGRIAGWLHRQGESEMADLFLNDRAAFDRRRESGRSQVHDTPGMKAMRKALMDVGKAGRNEGTKPRDTGLTEVVTGERE